jgi:hypothetical protein
MTKQTMERDFFNSESVSSAMADFEEATRLLAGTRSAFWADFCMESDVKEGLTAAAQGDYARALFAAHLSDSEVGCALSIPVGDALPENAAHGVGVGRRSDFAILPSALDDENFGNPTSADIFSHFFVLAARPRDFTSFSRDLLRVTDRLTAAPFTTTEYTDLTIRVMLEDDLPNADALAFALQCDEMSWMHQGGHPYGRVCEESTWSMSVFRDVIAMRYLAEGLDLTLDTPRAKWIETLSEIANSIVDEGLDPTADLAPDRRSADFAHIGGRDYHVDTCSNILIAQEMALALRRSCIPEGEASAYWQEVGNALRLEEMIRMILRAQKTSSELTYRKVVGTIHLTYIIEHEGRPCGKVISYNSTEDDKIADGSLVRIGDYTDYAILASEIPHMAAIMMERYPI